MRCLCSVIGRSCYKHHFCCDKTSVMTSTCLSWQNISFVATKLLSWQAHVCHDKTYLLLRQKYACHDKHHVVMTSIPLSQQKACFVATNTFCWCSFVATNICCNKSFIHAFCDVRNFVMPKVLSQQAYFFVVTKDVFCHNRSVCHDKTCHNKNDPCGSSRQWSCTETPPLLKLQSVSSGRNFWWNFSGSVLYHLFSSYTVFARTGLHWF